MRSCRPPSREAGLFDNLNFANARQPASTEAALAFCRRKRAAPSFAAQFNGKEGRPKTFLAEQSHGEAKHQWTKFQNTKKRQAPKNKQAPNDKLQSTNRAGRA